MWAKDETFDSYKTYEAWLKTQYDILIKMLHTDRGGEYMSNAFSEHLRKAGTIRRLTVHDTPEYNGVAERFNRTAIEKVRALLYKTGLPKFLWGKALLHVVYLKNRTWTRASPNATPHEILTGKKPDLSNIHPWGARVWVHDAKGSKLDGRAKERRWVGFDEESRGHCIYWEARRSVTIKRSVTFVPTEVDVQIGTAPVEGEREDFDEILEEVDKGNQPIPLEVKHPADDLDHPIMPQAKEPSPDKIPKPPEHIQPEIVAEDDTRGRGKQIWKESAYVRRIQEGDGSASGRKGSSAIPKGIQLPPAQLEEAMENAKIAEEDWAMATVMDAAECLNPTYQEAKRRPNWPKWQEAIKAKLTSLEKNGTWSVVEMSKGC
jgi:hypothetical protein